MDLSDPTRAISGTLDGAVLAALASAGRPMTVGQVAEQAVRGSEIGVRRSLARLIDQGIVRATLMGRNQVHELNRDHIAASVAEGLAGLRTELWRRFRVELSQWNVQPLYASVFGSAARGTGDESSDIDLLLVHPPFPGEKKPQRMTSTLNSQIADALGDVVVSRPKVDASQEWEHQIDGLRDRVEAWTGNRLQVVDLPFAEWRRPSEQSRPLLANVARDGIELVTSRALSLWPTAEDSRG